MQLNGGVQCDRAGWRRIRDILSTGEEKVGHWECRWECWGILLPVATKKNRRRIEKNKVRAAEGQRRRWQKIQKIHTANYGLQVVC
jgi:RNA:NAD 2'-phosphotransferase (TPT1/KptA family)